MPENSSIFPFSEEDTSDLTSWKLLAEEARIYRQESWQVRIVGTPAKPKVQLVEGFGTDEEVIATVQSPDYITPGKSKIFVGHVQDLCKMMIERYGFPRTRVRPWTGDYGYGCRVC